MEADRDLKLIYLNPGTFARLRNANGRTVTAVCGTVWITQQNDARDVVLEERGAFIFDRDGIALAGALGGPALLAADHGIVAERVAHPVLPASADLSPGSPLYRRAHELRALALEKLLRALAARMRCFFKNLMHRAGLPVQPC